MSTSDISFKTYLEYSFFGVLRGSAVRALIHPLQVVKTHQQVAPQSTNSARIASNLWQTHGPSVFLKGLWPELKKTCSKQFWCWPLIKAIPEHLNGVHPLLQQTVTGLTIATLDATSTYLWEKRKIHTILAQNSPNAHHWHGFGAYLRKLSVNWSTFLVAQKYLRDRAGKENLSLAELSVIGVKTALIVSLTSAPFDTESTRKLSGLLNVHKGSLRGLPLSALSLIIQNIASVILIYKLETRDKSQSR